MKFFISTSLEKDVIKLDNIVHIWNKEIYEKTCCEKEKRFLIQIFNQNGNVGQLKYLTESQRSKDFEKLIKLLK